MHDPRASLFFSTNFCWPAFRAASARGSIFCAPGWRVPPSAAPPLPAWTRPEKTGFGFLLRRRVKAPRRRYADQPSPASAAVSSWRVAFSSAAAGRLAQHLGVVSSAARRRVSLLSVFLPSSCFLRGYVAGSSVRLGWPSNSLCSPSPLDVVSSIPVLEEVASGETKRNKKILLPHFRFRKHNRCDAQRTGY